MHTPAATSRRKDSRPAPEPGTIEKATPWPNGVTPTQEYEAALDYIREPGGHLFVTGRAGTGKSTLLRALRDLIPDEHVVVAPTGLAAVNVGGQTIHSFFGLPPRLIGPNDIRRSRNGSVMRRLKFLVIDEVSMVRADLMWAIDQSLRANRGRAREPFGGVRLVMFGDLHQLPPVVQEAEVAAHLDSTFGSPFFFSVSALNEGAGTALLELNHVFRQNDETLVRILNRIRDGEAEEDDLTALNARVHRIRTLGRATRMSSSHRPTQPPSASTRPISMHFPGRRRHLRPTSPATSANRRIRLTARWSSNPAPRSLW